MVEKMSLHRTVNEMYEKAKGAGLTTVKERWEQQDKIRCRNFCEKGLSCQLCSQGPCRIIPGKVEQGVCGIDAKAMVMRNIVFKNNMGLAAYTHHCREVARTLKATAQGKTPFTIKDESKIDILAKASNVDTSLPTAKKTAEVADKIIASLSQDSTEESVFVTAFAPESRKKVWREAGILPGGPLYVLMDTVTRAMTNIDGDYLSLAKSSLRLGIATLYGVQVPLELAQDALFGTPMPHKAEVDLGVLDPDYVNILPNGHEPFIGAAMIELAHQPEIQQLAKAAGAKGIHIIGSIETGQELMQRYPCDDVFVGLTGNWLNQEFALATGAVDLFAMDMNCSVPSLADFAQKFNTTLVAVSPIVGIPGQDARIDYIPEKAEQQARKLIEMAIENFKRRKGQPAAKDLSKVGIVTGFSNEAVIKALGGTLEPLLDVIKDGTLKGVVALVSCTTLRNGPQDSITVQTAKELIKRDLLVLSAGCGNAGCQVGGLTSLEAQAWAGPGLKAICQQLGIPPVLSFGTCTDCGRLALLVGAVANALNVDTAQLPIAVTAPEYMEQKATVDAFGAVALGLYTHVSPTPPVTGSPEVVKLLTEDVESLVGGKMAVGDEPQQIADDIEAHINSKRKALGI